MLKNKKEQPWHRFVFDIKTRRFVGKFDTMYKSESQKNFDSWNQLKIDDEIITERFGEIEFLIRKHENVSTIAENEKKYIGDSIDMKNLENMYFSIDNNTKDDNEAQ